MYVLNLIWDNLKSAIGDMFLYGILAFIGGMLILFVVNRIGGLTRKTVSGKMLSGCYYFLIPFILSLGFAIYGGIKGAKDEVIKDAHLTIDTAGEYSLGKFDTYLKKKGVKFEGHGYTSDSVAYMFVESVNTDHDSWKGELMHWTVSNTIDQLESRLVKEASSRSGIDEHHVDNVTDYLEKGNNGKEIGYLQKMGTGIAKNLVEKKVNFWVRPYLWIVLILTIVLTMIPLSHCIVHVIIVRLKKLREKDLAIDSSIRKGRVDQDKIDFK